MSSNNTAQNNIDSQVREAYDFLTTIIGFAYKLEASDIHVRAGHRILMRVNGKIRQVKGTPEMNEEMIERLLFPLMDDYYHEVFKRDHQVDFALTDDNGHRLRVNVYRQMGRISAVMRVISGEVLDVKELKLPPQVVDVVKMKQGLVVFAGSTGSGKSTTMAALINKINKERFGHILTIEDPVEYLFTEERCVISQRQIGIDVENYAMAMDAALREDSDVILMGDMRDAQSIDIALKAAETGRLVFSTLHAPTSVDAIMRMISSFSDDKQAAMCARLGQSLRAVVTQRLIPQKKSKSRAVACEVLSVNDMVRSLISNQQRISELKDHARSAGKVEGMLHFDEHLCQLVWDDIISSEVATKYASSETNFALMLKGL